MPAGFHHITLNVTDLAQSRAFYEGLLGLPGGARTFPRRSCDAIFQAGFLIERLLEPRPAPEAATVDPAEYEKLSREPRGFIAFRLVPRP